MMEIQSLPNKECSRRDAATLSRRYLCDTEWQSNFEVQIPGFKFKFIASLKTVVIEQTGKALPLGFYELFLSQICVKRAW